MEKSTIKKLANGVILIITALIFLLLTYLVGAGYTQEMDRMIAEYFYAVRNPGLTTLLEALTHLGDWESIVIICLLLLIYPKTRCCYGIPATLAAILTTAIKALVKVLVARPRPEAVYHLIEQGGFSYPSGHAITSVSVCVILIVMVRKNVEDKKKANLLTALLLIPALGIGLSRIYLGVHYPSDVLGGWCAGLGVAIIVWMAMDVIQKKKWCQRVLKFIEEK